ncbi:MAG: fibrobacter succinogenes major paralogous domain-containing protein [Bacteroidota bacterium]
MKTKFKIFLFPLLAIGLVIMLAYGCKKASKDSKPTPKPAPTPTLHFPFLTTSAVTLITQTTASCGGNITSDSGSAVTARGVCWCTGYAIPTIANSKTTDGTGIGNFTSAITGLTPNTPYTVMAYATISSGTYYGIPISFSTQHGEGSTVTDIDGNVYHTVTIGTQEWMVENLKTTRYRNGDKIGTTTPATLDISGEITPKYQWAYDGNESNVAVYGRLYTWYAATDSRNIAPVGWHVPTDAEWTTLIIYWGDSLTAGGKMKEAGTTHWHSPNTGADNSSGFTALPGGWRGSNFAEVGWCGKWWSSTEYVTNCAWERTLFYGYTGVQRSWPYEFCGFSVRCVKD